MRDQDVNECVPCLTRLKQLREDLHVQKSVPVPFALAMGSLVNEPASLGHRPRTGIGRLALDYCTVKPMGLVLGHKKVHGFCHVSPAFGGTQQPVSELEAPVLFVETEAPNGAQKLVSIPRVDTIAECRKLVKVLSTASNVVSLVFDTIDVLWPGEKLEESISVGHDRVEHRLCVLLLEPSQTNQCPGNQTGEVVLAY